MPLVHHLTGLNRFLLAELAQILQPQALVALAPRSPLPWAQRLGFLLDHVGASSIADPLARWVAEREAAWCPLVPGRSEAGVPRATRWKLTVNQEIEVEA
jgi:hypothetical protein